MNNEDFAWGQAELLHNTIESLEYLLHECIEAWEKAAGWAASYADADPDFEETHAKLAKHSWERAKEAQAKAKEEVVKMAKILSETNEEEKSRIKEVKHLCLNAIPKAEAAELHALTHCGANNIEAAKLWTTSAREWESVAEAWRVAYSIAFEEQLKKAYIQAASSQCVREALAKAQAAEAKALTFNKEEI